MNKTDQEKLASINNEIRIMAGVGNGRQNDGLHMHVNTSADFAYRAFITIPKSFLPGEVGVNKTLSATGATALLAAQALKATVETSLVETIESLKTRLVDAKTTQIAWGEKTMTTITTNDYLPDYKPVDFVIEATDTERLFLWCRNDERRDGRKVSWQDIPAGKFAVIGDFHGHPVSIGLAWAIINGRKVCFYAAESRVVDHNMVKSFVRAHVGSVGANYSDAMNFHNTLASIEMAKTSG